ncbi:thermonuclease family protein [Qingshengfaniella alkalisoli]|uniref:thermonuclease family protein n=1 Tax=Qingshengfaniella alkalisoli TaxID=2599296 RepID=UPI00143CEDA6|nr:thermonuclease family protein [Qingshengfaniella alkalisoli]
MSTCTVNRVVDGDTVNISCSGRAAENARIIGYDTPETFEPRCTGEAAAGAAATAYLRHMLDAATTITVVPSGDRDRYGRPLIRLETDGQDVAGWMVTAGHAERYSGGRRPDWCAAG